RQAEKLGLSLPAFFGVSVLPFPVEISEKQQQQIQYLITTSLRKQIVLHVFDNELLILLETHPLVRPTHQTSLALTLLTEQMAQRFQCVPLPGGCGTIYGDYSRVYASFQEALTVIRIRNTFPEELKTV